MYNHADKQEDKEKSYIELDSTETEIIKYLNDNYKDVILLVKSSAAMELDWLKQYPNIKAVVYSQKVSTSATSITRPVTRTTRVITITPRKSCTRSGTD